MKIHVLTWFIAYVSFAFMTVEINPLEWVTGVRVAFVGANAFLSFCILIITE